MKPGKAMMKTTTIRMDDELKRKAYFNTFVVMATKQLVAQNKIPFELVVPKEDETLQSS